MSINQCPSENGTIRLKTGMSSACALSLRSLVTVTPGGRKEFHGSQLNPVPEADDN